MIKILLYYTTRYYEKRRRRLKGQRGEEELDEAAQVVEFDDLKGNPYNIKHTQFYIVKNFDNLTMYIALEKHSSFCFR